jgi:H+/Cl- antiporter ClcA
MVATRSAPVWHVLGLAAFVGVGCGAAGALFLALLGAATAFRVAHEAIAFALPAAGFALGLVYDRLGREGRGSTNLVVLAARGAGEPLPRAMAPLVLVGTVLTHLFGGSAGREGTAVQMGGGIGERVACARGIDAAARRVLVVAGVAGGFGAVFGTPLAGIAFALEAVASRSRAHAALVPAAVAGLVGDRVARALGASHTAFRPVNAVPITAPHLLRLLAFAAVVAAVATLFVVALGAIRTRLESRPLRARMAVGGLVLVAMWRLAGTGAYLGLSLPLALRALEDPALPLPTFALKLAFTLVTLGAGFVGGEVTPLFVAGAALGNLLARGLALPLDLGAGVGLVSLFGAAAKAPLALAIMAGEILGWSVLPHALVVTAAASWLVGRRTLYPAQLERE